MQIRYKYVNKYKDNRIVKIVFGKQEEKESYILMKNLGGVLHTKHTRKVTGEKLI